MWLQVLDCSDSDTKSNLLGGVRWPAPGRGRFGAGGRRGSGVCSCESSVGCVWDAPDPAILILLQPAPSKPWEMAQFRRCELIRNQQVGGSSPFAGSIFPSKIGSLERGTALSLEMGSTWLLSRTS